MKKGISIALVLVGGLLLSGCAQVKSGLCWVDQQIPACEWAGEAEAATPKANDPLPGS